MRVARERATYSADQKEARSVFKLPMSARGVPKLTGVFSNVSGVSSPRDPLSADNSLRRRFGVHACSIASGSYWKAEVAVKQYCVK